MHSSNNAWGYFRREASIKYYTFAKGEQFPKP